MAVINYTGIMNALKTILDADSRTNTGRVFIEEEPQFDLMGTQQAIAAFMDSRSAPAGEQALSQGKRTRMHLRIVFIVLGFSIESYKRAADIRNTLLANLEATLMDNRTISNNVTTSWLEGGDMVSAKDVASGVWTAAAETVLTAEVSVVNA